MANPNPKIENLTNAGKGRPCKPEKVRVTTTINAETKQALQLMPGSIGDNIDLIFQEWKQIKNP